MNYALKKLKQSPRKLFRKEIHYAWTMAFLVTCHVIYMTYFFHREWADTPAALAFINAVASVVPVISNLQQHAPPYTNYWGMFYAIFWVSAPIYWVFGLIGTFFLSSYRYDILIVKAKSWRVWLTLIISTVLLAYEFTFPMLAFGGFINQLSSFLPKLLITWIVGAGIIYGQARVVGALFIKSNLNQ